MSLILIKRSLCALTLSIIYMMNSHGQVSVVMPTGNIDAKTKATIKNIKSKVTATDNTIPTIDKNYDKCVGKFPNLITDICWSCMLPITIGSNKVANIKQEDNTSNPKGIICACTGKEGTAPTKIGLKTGFWEPSHIVEVTRKPMCMMSLGGISLDVGIGVHGGHPQDDDDGTKTALYHAHWITNPIMHLAQVLTKNSCIETGTFDVVYMTELDPLWTDDVLTMLLNPDVFLFSNPIAQTACAADCVESSLGFGIKELFWCAGCQGSMYPLNGHVASYIGGVQASYLITQRITSKMHRSLLTKAGSKEKGLCGMYLEPIMDKRNYKAQMLYPIPQTSNSKASTPVVGLPTNQINEDQSGGKKCCQPFGRTSVIWGSGKEYPVKGEDFSYQLFRKRNCCASVY